MTIKELIYKAKVKLQELTPYGSGLAVLDPSTSATTPLTEGLVVLDPQRYDKPVEIYIKECIEEAYNLLIELAPSNLIPSKAFSKKTQAIKKQNGSGYIVLPEDFHSLKLFKLIGWERPVIKTMSSDGPEYQEQYNEHLRGNFSIPKCAVVSTDEGKILEYYSLPKYYKKHEIEKGYYVPKLYVDSNDNSSILDIDDKIISVLIYLIVSRVQLIYEQVELSDKTKQTAIEELQILTAKL